MHHHQNQNQQVNGKQAAGSKCKPAKNSSQGNNNDETFQNEYRNQIGRYNRGPNVESSLASSDVAAGDDDDEFQDSSSQVFSASGAQTSAPDSGRSSAADEHQLDNLQADTTSAQSNKASNLVPKLPQVLEMVDAVRVKFLADLDDQQQQQVDEFEPLDIAELRKDLPKNAQDQDESVTFRWISRFFPFNQLIKLNNSTDLAKVDKAIGEAVERLREFLKFRHKHQLSIITNEQFCKEICQLNGIFQFGLDRNELPVLYIRARVHRKWSRNLDDLFRRYVAWQIDLITKSNPTAQASKRSIGRNGSEKDGSFVICFDCLHVSYSCLDMDFLGYLVKILVNYYPTYCRYAVCLDLPWIFRSVWKLVCSWLPEEARDSVHLIAANQLVEFISAHQIPNSINFSNVSASDKPQQGKHGLPEDWDTIRTFDELAKEMNLSLSERKQFKLHAKKVFAEYEQSGAI